MISRRGIRFLGLVLGAAWILAGPRHAASYFQDAADGVRPAGMGGAFTAVADDANTLLFNPAGLARLKYPELTSMYADLYHNLNARLYTGQNDQLGYNFAAVALPVSNEVGAFGVSWTHFYSVFYKENTYTLSYGRQMLENHLLDVGVNLKAMHWLVEGNDYTQDTTMIPERQKLGVTADAGLLCSPIPDVTLGVGIDQWVPVAMNFAGTRSVPLVLRAGASFTHRWTDSAMNSIRLALEWHQRGEVTTPKAGLEMWMLGQTVGLRTGWNVDAFTAGASFRYHALGSPLDFEFDYAYAYPFKIMETIGSHRLGLTFRWRTDADEEAAAIEPEIAEEPPEPPAEAKDLLDEYYQEALKAYYLEDWPTSAEWWKRILEVDPNNLTAQKYLADCEARIAAMPPLTAAGEARFAPSQNLFPGDPLRFGVQLSKVANLTAAQPAERLEELHMVQALAEKYAAENRLTQAIETWDTVRALSDDPARAEAEIRRLEDRLARDKDAQFKLGTAAFNAKDYRTALRQFRAVLKADPEHHLSSFYLDKTKAVLANRLARHYRVGVRLFERKNYSRALDYFTLVFEISPDYQECRNYLAEIKDRLRRALRSRPVVTTARAELRESRVGAALRRLVPVIRERADDQNAARLFEQMIARKAQSVRIYEQGLQLYARKEFDGAIGSFRSSLALDPESPARDPLVQAYIQKGILEYRQNRLNAALAAWESVLPLQEDNEMVKIYIQRVKNKIEYYKRNLGANAPGADEAAPASPAGGGEAAE